MATHPSLLCTKMNSRQDSVAVTEGRDVIPSTTSRHSAMAPDEFINVSKIKREEWTGVYQFPTITNLFLVQQTI